MSVDDNKHEPGYASLAFEVLSEAKRSGVDMSKMSTSLWAQYLLWHARNMRIGVRTAELHEREAE